MAPRQKSIVIYYDFSDVLESSTVVSNSSGSHDASSDRSDSPRRSLGWSQRNLDPSYQYNLKLFDTHEYDNVHHTWEDKPFVVRSMPAFFGATRQQQLARIVHRNRAKLQHTGNFDQEGLVLTEGTTPFRRDVLFGIKTSDEPLPKGMQVEYISGTYVSKVFLGHDKDFAGWSDRTVKMVQKANGIRPNQKHSCFTYHPTSTKNHVPEGSSLIAVFIKVSCN
mmetsp:Transcript_19673/g.42380  ORF Transcript_19673/g.42380 Transcript_19673/m.42380 type:complete len:222 (+) Transcript_19673:306-971(+)